MFVMTISPVAVLFSNMSTESPALVNYLGLNVQSMKEDSFKTYSHKNYTILRHNLARCISEYHRDK